MRLKIPLLDLLKENSTVSGEELAGKLGISRQALHKQISKLREKGYSIEGKNRSGYRVKSKPDLLTEDAVKASLKSRWLGKNYIYLSRTDSTQERAKDLAGKGAPEGTVVLAETQISGRGRFDRKWVSGKGGLWFSVILRPRVAPHSVPQMALAASLAVSRAVEKFCGATSGVKWPNDVFSGGKKVCGILTEMEAESERVNWVVLGLGLNVNNRLPASLKKQAAGLSEITGRPVDRAGLLSKVLENLEAVYEKLLRDGFESLRRDYEERLLIKGKTVTLSDFERKVSGLVTGIGEDGSLTLVEKGGKKRSFWAGDVTFR